MRHTHSLRLLHRFDIRYVTQPQLVNSLSTHNELLDLAGDSERKYFNEFPIAGNLVCGDLTTTELPDFTSDTPCLLRQSSQQIIGWSCWLRVQEGAEQVEQVARCNLSLLDLLNAACLEERRADLLRHRSAGERQSPGD